MGELLELWPRERPSEGTAGCGQDCPLDGLSSYVEWQGGYHSPVLPRMGQSEAMKRDSNTPSRLCPRVSRCSSHKSQLATDLSAGCMCVFPSSKLWNISRLRILFYRTSFGLRMSSRTCKAPRGFCTQCVRKLSVLHAQGCHCGVSVVVEKATMNRQKMMVVTLVTGIVAASATVHVWLPFYSQASQDKRAVLNMQARKKYQEGYNMDKLKRPMKDVAAGDQQ